MTESEYFPIAAGGRWARLIFSNTSPMPVDGVVESAAETAQRLATRLRHLVPAAVYAELVQLLIADVVDAGLCARWCALIAEPRADAIAAAAALLWAANHPDRPAWHELDDGVRADYRAVLDHYDECLAQHQDTVRRGYRMTKTIDRGDREGLCGDG